MVVPVGTHSSSGVNQSSFYSSQTHSVHGGGPVGSANYERVQAKYGMSKDFGSMRTNMNYHANNSNHQYEAQGVNPMAGSNGMQGMAGQSPDEKLAHMSPYRHRIKQRERSIHNLSLQHTQPLDDNPTGERPVQPMVGIA